MGRRLDLGLADMARESEEDSGVWGFKRGFVFLSLFVRLLIVEDGGLMFDFLNAVVGGSGKQRIVGEISRSLASRMGA